MSRELEEIVLEKTERDKLIDELTLALLYLTSFTEEIGAIVGISTKNVSVRLYRIKEELKKMSNH
mgnify:CR=1 FL=1